MYPLDLEGLGKIVSFTTLQMPPEGFTLPLTIALVELRHGAMILCLAENQSEPEPKIGDQVRISLNSKEKLQFRCVP
jgi:uncharacterized OB-fold protein